MNVSDFNALPFDNLTSDNMCEISWANIPISNLSGVAHNKRQHLFLVLTFFVG
jgi:hypothetical protein